MTVILKNLLIMEIFKHMCKQRDYTPTSTNIYKHMDNLVSVTPVFTVLFFFKEANSRCVDLIAKTSVYVLLLQMTLEQGGGWGAVHPCS